MALIPDPSRPLVWSVLLLLFLRFASIYAFVYISVNFGVLLRASIHVQAANTSAPTKQPNRNSRPGLRRNNSGSNRRPNPQTPNSIPSSKKPLPNPPSKHPTGPSPPPYSLTPPKAQDAIRPESLLSLYEDIIASDNQTIQVQQDTLCTQQETIRAQAQMIKMMRQVIEDQDDRIEDLERVLAEREREGEGRSAEVARGDV